MEDDEFPFAKDFEWAVKDILGGGSFGKVYRVKDKRDGQNYAIKQMLMEPFNKDAKLMEALKSEISITEECASPYTVKIVRYQIGKKFTYIVL
jgi:serine/threonine protein kinase